MFTWQNPQLCTYSQEILVVKPKVLSAHFEMIGNHAVATADGIWTRV